MANDPRRVLVLEDEWLIAAGLADMLTEMGFSILGPVPTPAQALALVEREPPDCALLDVSLGLEKSFVVAEALKAKGIPFVFLTGYLAADLPPSCAGAPILAKPVHDADLKRLLPALFGEGARRTAA